MTVSTKDRLPSKESGIRKRKFRGKEPRWLVLLSEHCKRPRKIVYDSSSDEENIPNQPSKDTTQTDTHTTVTSTITIMNFARKLR